MGYHWRPHSTMGLLVRIHGVLLVHRIRAPCGSCSGYGKRRRSYDRRKDQNRTSNDRAELVHIPFGVLVPHARLQSSRSGCLNSNGLLRLRHNLQVWCRLGDLQDLLCQIPKGGPLAMRCLIASACFFNCCWCPPVTTTCIFQFIARACYCHVADSIPSVSPRGHWRGTCEDVLFRIGPFQSSILH